MIKHGTRKKSKDDDGMQAAAVRTYTKIILRCSEHISDDDARCAAAAIERRPAAWEPQLMAGMER